MFNEMICSRCKDIVSITSTAVTLPFICEECTEAENFQEQIAPPEVLSDDTATVENTTLLIADLEQQIAGSKEALDKSTELIADLTQQLTAKQAQLCEYDAAGLDVTKKFLRVTIQRDGWRKYAYELAGQIEELSARVAKLQEFNKHLGTNLIESRNRAKRNFERGREDWKKAFFYETRGFWARLFNARYES